MSGSSARGGRSRRPQRAGTRPRGPLPTTMARPARANDTRCARRERAHPQHRPRPTRVRTRHDPRWNEHRGRPTRPTTPSSTSRAERSASVSATDRSRRSLEGGRDILKVRASPRGGNRPASRQSGASPRRRPVGRRDHRTETPAFARRRVRTIACDSSDGVAPRSCGERSVRRDRQRPAVRATSASRHVVDPQVVVNVGKDYRDLMNAGKAQADAARPTTEPVNPKARLESSCRSDPLGAASEAHRGLRSGKALARSAMDAPLGCPTDVCLQAAQTAVSCRATVELRRNTNAGLGPRAGRPRACRNPTEAEVSSPIGVAPESSPRS